MAGVTSAHDDDMDTLAQDDDASDGIQDDRISRNFRASRNGRGVIVLPGALDTRWRTARESVDSWQLIRAWRGVYLPRCAADDIRELLAALQDSAGFPIIACHSTAAFLQGFDITGDRRLHVTTPDARSIRPRPGLVIHQELPRTLPVDCGGILVTAAPDTAVDLARSVPTMDVLAVLDAAMRVDVTTDQMLEAIERAGRRRGVRQVRDWQPYADWRAESPMESRTRQRILAAGLPAPDLQVEVRPRDSAPRFLDMGWRTYRVGVEYDGRGAHADSGEDDRERHNDISDLDWLLYYPTARSVYVQHLKLIDLLSGALRRRGYCGPIGVPPDPATVPRPAPGPASWHLGRPRSRWSEVPEDPFR